MKDCPKDIISNNSSESDRVEEPALDLKNSITFYTSHEESKLDELRQVLRQSPQQRIRDTVNLILRASNLTIDSLDQRHPNNEIRIIRSK